MPVQFTLDITIEIWELVGIEVIQADDFSKWILSVEVLGDTLYKVRSQLLLISHYPRRALTTI